MPKRIFIVDDSKLVRQLVRSHLESRLEHIVCTEAADGLEAVQRVREVEPDVIVVDLGMPVMNGLEAAAAMHDMLPRVPIILFTVHKDIVSEKRAEAVGIRAVVSKTDQMNVLLREIQKFTGIAGDASA